VPVLIDGAQAIQHQVVDVQDINCDFYVFSGHKVYGPTGIGVLFGKTHWLTEMGPYQGGGDMVDCVSFERTTYNELPFKFEAGTTNYIGAIGLAEALSYIREIGLDNIAAVEHDLLNYGNKKLLAIDGLRIIGEAKNKTSIFSFVLEDIHQYDAGMIMDKMGIAVRTGTHCAQPIMDRFGVEGTIRASFCFYNTREEIDLLVEAIQKVKQMFG
ncbi:MAG: aminotransferase class V-fold PLP-dependent enzyme, partial [Bacteroidota bacterium]